MAAIPKERCPHLPDMTRGLIVATSECGECGLTSPTRVCLTCGHVGCCDSSNGHATAHSQANSHAIIRSLPLSDSSFTWCYACKAYLT